MNSDSISTSCGGRGWPALTHPADWSVASSVEPAPTGGFSISLRIASVVAAKGGT